MYYMMSLWRRANCTMLSVSCWTRTFIVRLFISLLFGIYGLQEVCVRVLHVVNLQLAYIPPAQPYWSIGHFCCLQKRPWIRFLFSGSKPRLSRSIFFREGWFFLIMKSVRDYLTLFWNVEMVEIRLAFILFLNDKKMHWITTCVCIDIELYAVLFSLSILLKSLP